jgi:hypothetical protein
MLEAEFLPTSIKLIPVCFSFFGAGLALVLNLFFQQLVTVFTTFKLYVYIYNNYKIKVIATSILNYDKVINFKFNPENQIQSEYLLVNIPNAYKFLNKK